jgi:hypothetical protein
MSGHIKGIPVRQQMPHTLEAKMRLSFRSSVLSVLATFCLLTSAFVSMSIRKKTYNIENNPCRKVKSGIIIRLE